MFPNFTSLPTPVLCIKLFTVACENVIVTLDFNIPIPNPQKLKLVVLDCIQLKQHHTLNLPPKSPQEKAGIRSHLWKMSCTHKFWNCCWHTGLPLGFDGNHVICWLLYLWLQALHSLLQGSGWKGPKSPLWSSSEEAFTKPKGHVVAHPKCSWLKNPGDRPHLPECALTTKVGITTTEEPQNTTQEKKTKQGLQEVWKKLKNRKLF